MVGRIVLLFLYFFVCSPAAQAELSEQKKSLIQELFPSATVISEKLEGFPVYPVYQLQELLGYAYESVDLSPLQGFAGKPISMLVGMDTRGRFTGVKVLNHHEPVFLHGIGEKPLLDFVDQYEGRSLREQIIINTSNTGSAGRTADGNTVYFDGVSKATVSVLIINDTILSSALEVARNNIAGFAQAPPTRAKPDFFEPLTWQQLLNRGYIGQWQLSREAAESELGRSLADYPQDFDDPDNGLFTELFFGYVNAPMVGRNLLGDDGYQMLMESLGSDTQVMLVMSKGMFPHVPESFIPGSISQRLSLSQGGLALEMRDLNLSGQGLELQATGMPDLTAHNFFRIGGSAGYNPGADATLKFHIELSRNHLVQDLAIMDVPAQFNPDLFEKVEPTTSIQDQREPVWIGLWKQRWWQIALVVTALAILSVFFAYQRTLSRHPKLVHRFRWGFLFFTLFFIGFYAQGQLSVVNIYTLLLAIWDGFSLNVFLLDPIIFILWLYTFISLFIWGRGLFCGWLCPFGALQEMTAWLGKKLGLRQIKVPERWHRRLILIKYPILIGLLGTAFYSLALAEKLVEVEPFKTSITLYFVRYWPFVIYALGLLAIGLFIHKFYCRYLCPLGAGLAILGRLRLFSWLDRVELCGNPCQHCKNACGINAIRKDGRIDYDECIQCLECVVILNDEQQCVDKRLQNKKRSRPANILATDASLS
ncbi:regulatory protein NosR [Streptosporangium jomthongense]|uniref:4Fe-4S binding protein n=1 Tax=Marinobacter aromaticivorans TaxID=1494078 RepID=A0ABW2IZH4_9GAMM|nr:NosR/NirI family protein [Marinobacter aromaticivorans]GGE80400.1 regulatory protein NosR [Streptosporangium jomthongense]